MCEELPTGHGWHYPGFCKSKWIADYNKLQGSFFCTKLSCSLCASMIDQYGEHYVARVVTGQVSLISFIQYPVCVMMNSSNSTVLDAIKVNPMSRVILQPVLSD